MTEIVSKYNSSQNDYEVKAVYKGSYPETLTAGIAAYRAKTQPHLRPGLRGGDPDDALLRGGLSRLPADEGAGIKIDWTDFLGVVRSYYSQNGELYSMPFNSSTAILYYNRTIFKKAGLDPTKPPKTYEEIEKAAKACVTRERPRSGSPRPGPPGPSSRMPTPGTISPSPTWTTASRGWPRVLRSTATSA